MGLVLRAKAEAGVERREVVGRLLEGHRRGCLLEVEIEVVRGYGQDID